MKKTDGLNTYKKGGLRHLLLDLWYKAGYTYGDRNHALDNNPFEAYLATAIEKWISERLPQKQVKNKRPEAQDVYNYGYVKGHNACLKSVREALRLGEGK